MKNLFDLSGKVAVVTGASSGLGFDAACAYAAYGADVALLARRKEKLEKAAEQIRAMGRKALIVPCDVADENSVKEATEQVLAYYKKVDIILNNAGIAIKGDVVSLKIEDWDRVMNTNVRGIYLICKYLVPSMQKQKYGKIINIASMNAVIADKAPVLARHVYNTSKAAVRGLTLGMAASYMQEGITVNAIGPGLFESEMTEGTLFKNEDFLRSYNTQTPAGRPGKKGELNGTILYFSSDASSYVTGQFIVVDGGFCIV